VGPRAGLDAVEERKFLPFAGNRTPGVQGVARRYTDWALSAPMSELSTSMCWKSVDLWDYTIFAYLAIGVGSRSEG
jgi:hypothetical protein